VEGSAAGAGEKSRPPPVPAPTTGEQEEAGHGEGRCRSFARPQIDTPPELLLCSSAGPRATGGAAQDGAAMAPRKRMGRGRRGGAEGRTSLGRWSVPPLLSWARRA
jgi:hypothetical protein